MTTDEVAEVICVGTNNADTVSLLEPAFGWSPTEGAFYVTMNDGEQWTINFTRVAP